MELVWLVALILASGAAIAGGHGVKGKLLNIGIILGCMALGFSIGYAAGLGSENMGRVRDVGWSISLLLGIVASMGCMKLNIGK
ncbi:MAG TPA: hypothetical protein VMU53_01030 [Candidatus Sulfotelmatobacter sp.]|nr:hypothetical protein [Candidatus Sulfotelmatobacter sp.]